MILESSKAKDQQVRRKEGCFEMCVGRCGSFFIIFCHQDESVYFVEEEN